MKNGLKSQVSRIKKKTVEKVSKTIALYDRVDQLKKRLEYSGIKNKKLSDELKYDKASISGFFNKKEGRVTERLADLIDDYLTQRGVLLDKKGNPYFNK